MYVDKKTINMKTFSRLKLSVNAILIVSILNQIYHFFADFSYLRFSATVLSTIQIIRY